MYDPILCMNVPYSVKTKDAEYKMEVTTYVINEGQSGQYYGLKNKKNNQVLHSAPNNWKTKSGAKKWAESKGFVFVEDSKIIDKAIRNCTVDKDIEFPSEKEAIEYCKENGLDPHKIILMGDKYIVRE